MSHSLISVSCGRACQLVGLLCQECSQQTCTHGICHPGFWFTSCSKLTQLSLSTGVTAVLRTHSKLSSCSGWPAQPELTQDWGPGQPASPEVKATSVSVALATDSGRARQPLCGNLSRVLCLRPACSGQQDGDATVSRSDSVTTERDCSAFAVLI